MVEGKTIDGNGNEINIKDESGKYIEPMMNSYGVVIMCGLFREFLTKNTSMSNIEDIAEVDKLRNHQMERVVETLMLHKTAFGIKNDTIRSNIAGYIVSQSHVALKQPYENGLKVWLGKTTQEITQKVNQSNRNSDSGWFNFLSKK
jgi:predicted P-loop ATPase